jgi:hypothetical protein
VIGGGPAAAVVFGGEVRKRTEADRRLLELGVRIAQGDGAGAGCGPSSSSCDPTASIHLATCAATSR